MFDDPLLAVINGWMIIQMIIAVVVAWICVRSIREEHRHRQE